MSEKGNLLHHLPTLVVEQVKKLRLLFYKKWDEKISDKNLFLIRKTVEYLKRSHGIIEAFELLHHLRPGEWVYSTKKISEFDQYDHLANIEKIVRENKEIVSVVGVGYIIKPDIIVARFPVSDKDINKEKQILNISRGIARKSPFIKRENSKLILHASISCKWTIRNDRSQNTRTEAINLIRNRKGHTPRHSAPVIWTACTT